MALFYECMLKCARKLLDTADIVREAILRQLLEHHSRRGANHDGATLELGRSHDPARFSFKLDFRRAMRPMRGMTVL